MFLIIFYENFFYLKQKYAKCLEGLANVYADL